ncbi:DUF748 domain-containing protein [Xanthomarina sp. F1114]|uniref:DUF748 domain-containing protein n=1 Tax=Xanthomarina sp. F1114 TaxID=2996019 RepID=UPI00225E337A|nr:DUF748 domain-containing protein [Xanthomarina sp. F1114]MCX7546661.1 DUF748 domain-containing protein [Xanthomarina sp. F1114]
MKTKNNRKAYKKKRYIIPILLIAVLFIFRLYLPTLVKNYVNKVLADIPGYYGQVEDIDIALVRGAYKINGMYLNKVNAQTQIPFLDFPKTDISIEWKSLFKGEIVSEIIMMGPKINYVLEDQETDGENPDMDSWTKALTDLVPIKINHFEVHNGKLSFLQEQAEPKIDLHFDNLELTADNLRNVREEKHSLPSPITASAVSIGQGNMSLKGHLNLIKDIPDMDIEFALENTDATALNDFTKHYANINFESGEFNLYSEIAIADGYLKGYMKPLLKNSKLIGKDDNFIETVWEGFVGFFKFALKNQRTDTLATKIPLEGDLNNLEAGVWKTFTNILSNAWVEAFKGVVDDDIEFKDAFNEEE